MEALGGTLFLVAILALLIGLPLAVINPRLFRNRKTGTVYGRPQLAAAIAVPAAIICVIGGSLLPDPEGHSKAVKEKPVEDPQSKSAGSGAQQPATLPTDTFRADAAHIRPESIVSFPKGMLACLNKSSLEKAIDYVASGERTKFLGLLVRPGGAGDCLMLDPHKHYRIIGADYDSDLGSPVFELVGTQVVASENGAFALIADPSLVQVVSNP